MKRFAKLKFLPSTLCYFDHDKLWQNYIYSLMHVVDWFPTLLNVSGAKEVSYSLDGVNQWETLKRGPPARDEFVYNIHQHKVNISGAIRQVGTNT